MNFCCLLNNAAIISDMAPIELQPENVQRRVFDVNYFAAVELTRRFLPLLLRNHGRVVFIGSAGAIMPVPFLSSYVASKLALYSFANVLRTEIERHGVSVTYVMLGQVNVHKPGRASTNCVVSCC